MASERKRGNAGGQSVNLSPELVERLQRTAPRPVSSMIYAAGAAALCLFVHPGAWAAGALPKLPTPCGNGATCGVNPLNPGFVSAGSATLSSPSSTVLNVN